MNKLRSHIRVHKDTLAKDWHNNVIHKILCNNCDASYDGQTSRPLKMRVKEYKIMLTETRLKSLLSQITGWMVMILIGIMFKS